MEYRYFSGKHESKFRTLSGDVQRAIETQVNIELEARKRSKYLGQSYQLENIQKFFFDNQCEKYANADKDTITRFKILESKYLYLFPLTKDRHEYWISRAKEMAQDIDARIDIDEKLKIQELRGRRNVER